MAKTISYLLMLILASACQALPAQSSPAQVLARQIPYQTGVEITKPTYTASPMPTAVFTPQPIATFTPQPTATFTPQPTTPSLPNQIPSPAIFSALDFVVLEDLSSEPDSSARSSPSLGYTGNKSILVVISEQHLYAYEGETLVFSFIASTGMGNSTRIGNFSVLEKIPNAYGATWNIWMPYWLGIYWSGNLQNGIHALPILPNGATLWAGYLGRPISYGCVVLGTYEAQLLYDWAEVGTPVEIRR
ncbi:MAG: hypothetical protein Fur0043_05590 [Anaerolineales bacterium]